MRSAMQSAFVLCTFIAFALISPAEGYSFKVIHDFCSNRGPTEILLRTALPSMLKATSMVRVS